jgi:hypothetical protein
MLLNYGVGAAVFGQLTVSEIASPIKGVPKTPSKQPISNPVFQHSQHR